MAVEVMWKWKRKSDWYERENKRREDMVVTWGFKNRSLL